MEKQSLYSLSRKSLRSWSVDRDIAPANADLYFSSTYRPWLEHHDRNYLLQTKSPSQDPISKVFLSQVETQLSSDPSLRIESFIQSQLDGSIKFVMETKDALKLETVLIVEKRRLTICLSSQVGCMRGCRFCNTARMGLVRNLRTDEIISQYFLVSQWIREHLKDSPQLSATESDNQEPMPLSNVVFMGMGEPLDNVENLTEALAIFLDPLGLGLAQRRVTVSTSGQLDGLEQLLKVFPQISLALSLHAASDSLRSRIMPINDSWNLSSIREKLLQIEKFRPNKEVLVQYTLIKGVNDSSQHIRDLAQYLEGLRVKLNVIPFNEFSDSLFKRPSEKELWEFVNHFSSLSSIRPLVRFSKARDVGGACGQLVVKKPFLEKVL